MKPRPTAPRPPRAYVQRADGVAEILRFEVLERAPCVNGHGEDEECDACRGTPIEPPRAT